MHVCFVLYVLSSVNHIDHHVVNHNDFDSSTENDDPYAIQSKGLTIMHLNIHYLLPKLQQVMIMLCQMSNRVKILGFSETFLDNQVKDSEIMIPGYNVVVLWYMSLITFPP